MKNNIFTTSDLNLSAALLATGHKLGEIDKSNPKQAIFSFDREENIDTVTAAYWSGELKISPFHFSMCQKQLKNQLYDSN